MSRPKGKGGERLAKNARRLKRQSHKLSGFLQIEIYERAQTIEAARQRHTTPYHQST